MKSFTRHERVRRFPSEVNDQPGICFSKLATRSGSNAETSPPHGMQCLRARLVFVMKCNSEDAFIVGVRLQQFLQIDHIETPAKLEADFAEMCYVFEACIFLQRDAAGLLRASAADDDVMAESSGAIEQIAQKCFTNAATMAVGPYVNRCLDRSRIAHTFVPRRERTPADDLTVRFGNRRRMLRAPFAKPRQSLRFRVQLELKSACRRVDVVVVNVA